MKNIIIATIKSWNIENSKILLERFSDRFKIFLITDKKDLKYNKIKEIKPEYIFFPHWSWKISKKIYNEFKCVLFHMTDLPFGRGGSPLQNLISRGIYDTKISAIKVSKEIDSGDIFLKKSINIKHGNVNEILKNVSEKIFFEMIPEIIENKINPIPQVGEVVLFKRRTPQMSNMMSGQFIKIHEIYDFIRMLDGEGYPKAFIQVGNFKIKLKNADFTKDKIIGNFEIVEESDENSDCSCSP